MENESLENEKLPKPQATEKPAIEIVREIDSELSEYRKQFEKEWREFDNAYYGKQHKTGEDKKTVKNHIFKIIEGEVPILTDSMPGTQVTASRQEKQAAADILNKSVKYVYQDQNLPLILPSLVRSSCMSAPGYLYVFHNPDAEGGNGKEEYIQLPWEYVKLDGNAQTIEQAEKAIISIPQRRGALARKFPEKKDEILDVQASKDPAGGTKENFENRDVSGVDSDMGRPKRFSAKDIVNYKETWLKDYALENIPPEETEEELTEERVQLANAEAPDITKWENHVAHQEDHAKSRAQLCAQLGVPADMPFEQIQAALEQLIQQNPQAGETLGRVLLAIKITDDHIEAHEELKKLNPTSQRPKFKDGWRVIKSCGGIILYDGPNPEERKGIGHIPLVPFYCYKDDTIYGFGEIKNILDPQRTHNTVDAYEYENLKLNANTGWVADHDSGVDASKLTNAPGLVILKDKGTEVRRLEPGEVSPQLERRKEMDEAAMEEISGINEATQGNVMPGAGSGIAIQKLQAQAIGRIRLKDRYLQHYSIKRLGILTAQLILNHWDEEKILRLRGDNGDIEDVIFNPLEMEDLSYTVEISPGSMAGIDKDALNGLFIQLYQLGQGAMSFEDLLSVLDIPKKEALIARIQAKNQQAQQLQEAQGQMQDLQNQNIQMRGLIHPELLVSEEKKAFDIHAKQALLEKLLAAQAPQQEMNGNPGVDQGQPVNQGNM
jgi:hypothetical protein